MQINRPTGNQRKAFAKIKAPTIRDLASYSNNRISEIRNIGGVSWCKLNGEEIRLREAFALLQEALGND